MIRKCEQRVYPRNNRENLEIRAPKNLLEKVKCVRREIYREQGKVAYDLEYSDHAKEVLRLS